MKGVLNGKLTWSTLFLVMIVGTLEEDGARVRLSDFELIKKIGQGGFGAVWVVRKKDTREVLALKVVNKSLIWKKNKVAQMKNERDVLASHHAAWMVQLAYSFQDPHYCYLAMEYCPGGDLRHLLSVLGYLEEHEVRLYMAEMILAVFSLHSLGYIHRDLKPDNFLIDSKGHLKLTDFGLSKDGSQSNVTSRRLANGFSQASSLPELSVPSSSIFRHETTPNAHLASSRTKNTLNMVPTPLFEPQKTTNLKGNDFSHQYDISEGKKIGESKRSVGERANEGGNTLVTHAHGTQSARAFSVVGSPHYMSPEVLEGEHGYGAEVDWWSLGCIFFEMVTGSPPFVGETPQQVFESIVSWKTTLLEAIEDAKDSISSECLDFIIRLFLCDPRERFSAKMGLARVFSHPFFKDFSIESIFALEPPFVPQLSDECDTTYFETDEDQRIGDANDFKRQENRERFDLEQNERIAVVYGDSQAFTSQKRSSHKRFDMASSLSNRDDSMEPRKGENEFVFGNSGHGGRIEISKDNRSIGDRRRILEESGEIVDGDESGEKRTKAISPPFGPPPSTVAIQCPQTAPRRLLRVPSRYEADFEDDHSDGASVASIYFRAEKDSPDSSFNGVVRTPHYHQSIAHSHQDNFAYPSSLQLSSAMSPARKRAEMGGYGRFAIQRTQNLPLACTPLRKRRSHFEANPSPKRDIAGFTFQRKKTFKPSTSQSASHSFKEASTSNPTTSLYDFSSDEAIMRYATARRSPEHFFGSPSSTNDFSTLYITPRALNFETATSTSIKPPSPTAS